MGGERWCNKIDRNRVKRSHVTETCDPEPGASRDATTPYTAWQVRPTPHPWESPAMHLRLTRGLAPLAAVLLIGWTAFHLEVTASDPEAGAVLAEAPTEVWLEFSEVPDAERTSFSVTGPDGSVPLGGIHRREGDGDKVLRANVAGPMPEGSYTVSWVGAPMDEHTVRGRFSFSIEAAR